MLFSILFGLALASRRLRFSPDSNLAFGVSKATLSHGSEEIKLSLECREEADDLEDTSLLKNYLLIEEMPESFYVAITRRDCQIFPTGPHDRIGSINIPLEEGDEVVIMAMTPEEVEKVEDWQQCTSFKRKWQASLCALEPDDGPPAARCTRTDFIEWGKLIVGLGFSIGLIMVLMVWVPGWILEAQMAPKPTLPPTTVQMEACSNDDECRILSFTSATSASAIIQTFEAIFGRGNLNQSSIHRL